jgi:hypothetical protein
MTNSLRATIHRLDPELPLANVLTMREIPFRVYKQSEIPNTHNERVCRRGTVIGVPGNLWCDFV